MQPCSAQACRSRPSQIRERRPAPCNRLLPTPQQAEAATPPPQFKPLRRLCQIELPNRRHRRSRRWKEHRSSAGQPQRAPQTAPLANDRPITGFVNPIQIPKFCGLPPEEVLWFSGTFQNVVPSTMSPSPMSSTSPASSKPASV